MENFKLTTTINKIVKSAQKVEQFKINFAFLRNTYTLLRYNTFFNLCIS